MAAGEPIARVDADTRSAHAARVRIPHQTAERRQRGSDVDSRRTPASRRSGLPNRPATPSTAGANQGPPSCPGVTTRVPAVVTAVEEVPGGRARTRTARGRAGVGARVRSRGTTSAELARGSTIGSNEDGSVRRSASVRISASIGYGGPTRPVPAVDRGRTCGFSTAVCIGPSRPADGCPAGRRRSITSRSRRPVTIF